MRPDLRQLKADARTAYREREAKDKPVTRRIYHIPVETLADVLRFQADHRLPTEVAAVRELLNLALTAKGYPKQ